MKTFTSVR